MCAINRPLSLLIVGFQSISPLVRIMGLRDIFLWQEIHTEMFRLSFIRVLIIIASTKAHRRHMKPCVKGKGRDYILTREVWRE